MTLDDFAGRLRDPGIEYRPELRWWLAEGLHTDATLRLEIETAHRLGFGGMEFLAMDEADIDHSRYGWGAEEWVHDSQIVVEETTKRAMSVSFTSGTNWSNANLPTITPDHPAAAKELDVVTEDLDAGGARRGSLPRIALDAPSAGSALPGHRGEVRDQQLVAVVAARVVDRTPAGAVLDVGSIVDLTDRVRDESLEWTAPGDGPWRLFMFWMHGTGQTASPSASVNYTVNYLDRDGVEAVIDYWDTVVLTPQRSAPLMAVSTTYHNQPTAPHRITVEKVRFDYVRTLTDLYIENMLRPFAAFLHDNGMTLRAEISYGLPFELTRPGPEVDGIENESLEFGSQIDAYRMLAGPAHLFGRQYSSETGATTRNHMLDHRFYDQIIATQLAAGITKTVLHGWASPAGAPGPTEWPGHEGMWPMFSERFDTRQPGSEFYPLWTEALGRYQFVLRQGLPRIDVGILRTDHFVDNTIGLALFDENGGRIPDEDAYGRLWMRNRQNHWWQDLGMQDAGWTYEFLDGSLLLHDQVSFAGGLVQPGGPGYQALIVYQSDLDADVAIRLLDWARQGLRIVVVHGARELKWLSAGTYTTHTEAAVRTPGLDHRDDELQQTMNALTALPTVAVAGSPDQTVAALRRLGVAGRAEFVTPNTNVLGHLREDGELLHLYLYHFLYETGSPTTVDVALPGEGAPYRIDPWQGSLRPHAGTRTENGRTIVTVTLTPGETALITLDRSAGPVPPSDPPQLHTVLDVEGWAITVEDWNAGEPELITEDRGLGYQTHEVRPRTRVTPLAAGTQPLRPWRELDAAGPEVSGTGQYTTTFTLDRRPDENDRFLLDLGSTAGGLGSVQLNGGAVRGFDTSHPVLDVTADLRPGPNTLVVRVSSSLNNRLLARGYYDRLPDVLGTITGNDTLTQRTEPRDHGLLGPVRLLREVAGSGRAAEAR